MLSADGESWNRAASTVTSDPLAILGAGTIINGRNATPQPRVPSAHGCQLPDSVELAPSGSKQVDDVEKPGNSVIADREPAQASSDGGDEPLQQPLMSTEATLDWIGDDTRERREHVERKRQAGHGPDGR